MTLSARTLLPEESRPVVAAEDAVEEVHAAAAVAVIMSAEAGQAMAGEAADFKDHNTIRIIR